jgi:gingipain R
MKKPITLAVMLAASLSVVASEWQKIKSNDEAPATINLTSSDLQTTTIHYSLSGFELKEVNTSRGKAGVVEMPESYPINQEGAPDLKRIATSIILPNYGSTSVEIVDANYKDYTDISIAPSKGILYYGQVPKDFVYADVYSKNEFYPGKIAEGRNPHIMRNVRGQVLDIYPFQYNPVTKTLRVYYDFTVEVKTNTNESGINSLSSVGENPAVFDQLYESNYLNYAAYKNTKSSARAPMDNANGRMLVICYDDFETAMKPFVEWKTLKGIETELVKSKSIGTTSAAIKKYVKDYYTKYPDFTYLVLVGDHQQVPTNILPDDGRGGVYSYGSDLTYAKITGNDIYPEVICGRISATQLSHVTSQVTKFVTYEKTPGNMDVNNFKTALTMSIEESPNPNEGDVTRFMRNIKTTLSPQGYTFRQLFEDGSGDAQPSVSNISAEINKGVGFLSWISHGAPTQLISFNYTTSQISALKNTKMWPMIWNCSCQTGNYTGTTSVSEAFLRAVNNTNPVGAIGAAMSTRNMPVGPSEEYGNAAAKLVADSSRKNKTYGAVTYDVYLDVAVQKYNRAIEFNCMNIFGDPSLQLRTDVPKTLTMSHHVVDPNSTTSLEVSSAVEGAYVALTINGKIIGTGYISGGKTTITFPSVANGDQILVTGTAFNYEPYFGKDVIGTSTSVSNELSNLVSLNVVPNPSSGLFTISFISLAKADYTLEIKNALGQIVYTQKQVDVAGNYHEAVDASSYSKGVYFISIRSLEKEMIRKIVVQ